MKSFLELGFFDDLDDERKVSVEGALDVIAEVAGSSRRLMLANAAHAFPELLFVRFDGRAVHRIHGLDDPWEMGPDGTCPVRGNPATAIPVSVSAFDADPGLQCFPVFLFGRHGNILLRQTSV
jgi:hypothetical protein